MSVSERVLRVLDPNALSTREPGFRLRRASLSRPGSALRLREHGGWLVGSGAGHDRPRAPGPQWSRSTDLDRRGGNLPARGARRALGSHRPTSGVRAASPYPRSLNRETGVPVRHRWETRLMPGPAPRPVATTEGGAAEMRRAKRRPPQAFCVPAGVRGRACPVVAPVAYRCADLRECLAAVREDIACRVGRRSAATPGGGVPMPSSPALPRAPCSLSRPAARGLRTRSRAPGQPSWLPGARAVSARPDPRCVRGVAVAIPGVATTARAIAQHGHQRAPLIALLSPSQPIRPRMHQCAGAVAGPSAAMRRMPRHSLCAPQQFHSRRQGIGIASR